MAIEIVFGQFSSFPAIPFLLRKTWLVFACGVAYLLYAIICQMQDAVPCPGLYVSPIGVDIYWSGG